MQLLCFPLSTNPRLLWTDTSISLLPRILGLLSLSGTQDGLVSDTAANVLFLVAVLWQLLVLSCGVWVGICHMNEEFPIIWPIKVCDIVCVCKIVFVVLVPNSACCVCAGVACCAAVESNCAIHSYRIHCVSSVTLHGCVAWHGMEMFPLTTPHRHNIRTHTQLHLHTVHCRV